MSLNHIRTMISITQRLRVISSEMMLRSGCVRLIKCSAYVLPKDSFGYGYGYNVKCACYSTEAAEQENNNTEELRSENDNVTTDFVNRNPRNLERMALAYKDHGWVVSHPRRNFWHKLYLEQSLRHIGAYIEHVNGHRVLSASTKEWAIKKQLYACNDVMAAYNVGRVIAQRCLEAGISCVKWEVPELIEKTDKINKFEAALKEEGLLLAEPRSLCEPIEYFPDIDHDKSTEVDLDTNP